MTVQLLVSLTNQVLRPGSTTTLHVELKNSSTNSIWTCVCSRRGHEPELPAVYVELIHPDKTRDEISPEGVPITRVPPPIKVEPRETRKWHVPITIRPATVPGDYRIEAGIKYTVDRRSWGRAVSNVLKVQVRLPTGK